MALMRLFALVIVPAALIAAAQAQDIPEGPGSKVVQRVCTACHDLGPIQQMFVSKDDWQGTVDDMMSKGADGTADDFKAIVTYLAKYFGTPVNVNSAVAASMVTDLEITDAEAAAIVKYRTDNGNFKAFADLAKVPGLDITKLNPLKQRIKFQ